MYDSSKHSCHSIARPRSSSKLAGVPTQMFIVLHAGYKKKNIPLSQNSQTRGKQRLPIVVPTTPLICFRVMCAPICKMIKWRKFETVFILIFITDFFILLIYIVSWIAWKYLTKALFIHVCIVLFSRGKRWLFGLIIGRKKMTKNATKAWNALISESQSCQSVLNELKRPCKLFLFLGFPLFFQLIMFAWHSKRYSKIQ